MILSCLRTRKGIKSTRSLGKGNFFEDVIELSNDTKLPMYRKGIKSTRSLGGRGF